MRFNTNLISVTTVAVLFMPAIASAGIPNIFKGKDKVKEGKHISYSN
jgi:hypothetical protein